ncbi:MAG: PEP-CTERM sorting domain-containing protein [Verrucomicrobia bacterium]|nr:PEP-CTERM sorting domain-containing protein [Verrucomicrobiota bacterium]
MSCQRSILALATGLAISPAALHGQVTAFSNNPPPGDLFVNPGSSDQGQAVGASGWYYNNVRNSGEVGIRTDLPRAGNGSVWFHAPSGSAQADIEYLANAVNLSGNYFAAGSLAPFSSLTGMVYDWYRSSASTVPTYLHPVMRVLLDADGDLGTIGDRGGLVFEWAYNPAPPSSVPTDTWVTQPIMDTSVLWGFGAFPDGGYTTSLSAWKSAYPSAAILGFSLGVGSGWVGDFVGAVDNAMWVLGGSPISTNFEVVPEPTTWATFAGLGLLGFALWRRHGRSVS